MLKKTRVITLFLTLAPLMLLAGCHTISEPAPIEWVVANNVGNNDKVWAAITLPAAPVTYGEYVVDSYYMRAIVAEYERRLYEIREAVRASQCVPSSKP